jgi:hypothetical protein
MPIPAATEGNKRANAARRGSRDKKAPAVKKASRAKAETAKGRTTGKVRNLRITVPIRTRAIPTPGVISRRTRATTSKLAAIMTIVVNASSVRRAAGRSPSSAMRDVVGRIAPVLKWIVFALIGLAVLFFVLRSGLQFLANFTDWARRLLDALRNFWANLFGGRRKTTEEEGQVEQEEKQLRERPFATFRNPFVGGRIGMAVPELIRYTFAAAQAWARERDLGRQPGETPLEFAARVGAEVPALEADLQRLAVLYARAVYARGGLPSDSSDLLRHFWQRLETVAEQPLSA